MASSQEQGITQPLKPFNNEPHLNGITLTGQARWSEGNLTLHFHLQHKGDDVLLPPSEESIQRTDGLWEHTCFEAFVSQDDQQSYYEINLCPNGNWNMYRLTGYRENLQPEASIERMPVEINLTESSLELSCNISLDSLVEKDKPLEISLTAVLEHPVKGCSFWAWKHSGKEADFHLRDSLTLLYPDQQS